MTAITDICRVCEGQDTLRDLFDEYNEDLLLMLRAFTNISVEADDELPKCICLKCDERLENAYTFKLQCEYTDQRLRIALSKGCSTIEFTKEKDVDVPIFEAFIPKSPVIEDESTSELLEEHTFDHEREERLSETTDEITSEHAEEYPVPEFDIVDDIIVEENIEHNSEENILVCLDVLQENCDGLDEDIVKPEDEDHLVEEHEDEQVDDPDEDDEHYYIEYENIVDSDEAPPKETNNTKIPKTAKVKSSRQTKASTDKLFLCNSCPEQFTTFNDLNLHKKTHGDKRFQCPTCLKWFSKLYRMKYHMKIHEEQREYQCSLCEKKYTNPGNLDRHVRHFHNQERHYTCRVCGLSFARSSILQHHLAVHSDERNFNCDLCDKKFKTMYYLEVHKTSHIPIEFRTRKRKPSKRPIQICVCPYCGKKSNNLTIHQNHMRTHTGEKPYECQICKKRFTFQQSLKTHMLMHTGEKPFRCDICDVMFRQIGHLQVHKLIHSGIKQHKCEYCDKTFAVRGNLNVHLRLHTGEKPYECLICNKRFYDSNGLKRHKLMHERRGQMQPNEDDGKITNMVNLDHSDVYLDELGNEYTEIIESEIPMEIFKLDRAAKDQLAPRVSAEWGSGWVAPEIYVEIQETASDFSNEDIKLNTTTDLMGEDGPKLIVRAEEILIVLFVLILWVAAIALFFNRWGKIRMLEPYQPKFQQQHRSSCPLVDLDSLHSHPRASVSRMSMGMAIPIQMPPCQFSSFTGNIGTFPHNRGYATFSRPRQNSVFVGPQVIAPKPPRKTRSAMDLHSMVLDEAPEPV